jgi:AcrR family transcriptional regulator
MSSTQSTNLNPPPKKSRGRPKKFDYNLACSQALELFWTRGYEGTSISDLSEALNMNRPSIYASFGNKEALFRIALDLYLTKHFTFFEAALSKPTLEEVAETLLEEEIALLTGFGEPRGCLLIQSALTCGLEAKSIKQLLSLKRKAMEAAIAKRIELTQIQRLFLMRQSPHALAKAIMTMYEGISIQAASGSTQAELKELIPLLKKVLP